MTNIRQNFFFFEISQKFFAMFFVFLITFIFSIEDFVFPKEKSYFLESNETDCIYDRKFLNTFTSNSVVCLVKCVFKSIKSQSKGGALLISLRNNFGTQNFIDNCLFTECSSIEGGSIYLNMDRKATTKIINSKFIKNSAKSTSGAIYINSEITNNLQVINCTLRSNSAAKSGGFIYFIEMNYSFENCIFSDNKLSNSQSDAKGGSIYCEHSDGLFTNCSFLNNYADSYYNSDGGAVSFLESKGWFFECTFRSNRVKAQIYKSKGGAISYVKKLDFLLTTINETIKKCTFYDNSCESYQESFGGAISSTAEIFSGVIKSNSTFSDVTFDSNSVKSLKQDSFGGAFYYGYIQHNTNIDQTVESRYLFDNTTFINNKACTNSSRSCGGAVSSSPQLRNQIMKYPNMSFINSNFINNFVYSSSQESTLLALGGAIHLNQTKGIIQNCTFNKNVAETFLSSFLIQNDEPQTLGGAVYLLDCTHEISDCLFVDNLGIGKSPKHVSTGRGGGLYVMGSNIDLYRSSFNNNTLIHYGHKFDIVCSIAGGAFCSDRTITSILDCIFFNNTATLQASEESSHLSAKIIGGAIFAWNKHSMECKNCTFKDNLANIPNHKENEFGGSLYLTDGNISFCTFENNVAYNGCDISFNQGIDTHLIINECFFIQNINKNHQIRSLFHFKMFSDTKHIFTNNKIFSNISTYLFDGKNCNEWLFENNCISPYNKEMFKSDEIIFLNSQKVQVQFEEAFKSSCEFESASQSIPIATQTQIMPTLTITQTQIMPTSTSAPASSLPSESNQTSDSLQKLKMINSIINLLIGILVFQVIIILLLIGMVLFFFVKKTNRNDENPLVSDI